MAYEDDDEVSTVLRHFRPRPDFALRGGSGCDQQRDWTDWRRRQRRAQQQQHRGGGGCRKDGNNHHRRLCDRGYSCVRYLAPTRRRWPRDDPSDDAGGKYEYDDGGGGGGGGGRLRLTYLHVHHRSRGHLPISVLATFDVSVDTRSVACVSCRASSPSSPPYSTGGDPSDAASSASASASARLKSHLDARCLSFGGGGGKWRGVLGGY